MKAHLIEIPVDAIMQDPRTRQGPGGMLEAIVERLPRGTPMDVALLVQMQLLQNFGYPDRGLLQRLIEAISARLAGDVEMFHKIVDELAADRGAPPEEKLH